MSALRNLHVIVTSLLYAEFVASGLSYMLLAMNIPYSREFFAILPLCDWATSVYLLCTAHVLHAASIFGWKFSFQYTVIAIGVVSVMEECGLQSGLIFGEYHFTPALGSFVTNNLPLLVPFLWFSLSYPIYIFTFLLVPQKSSFWHFGFSVMTASALLAGYDIVSEPIGILYGSHLWYHAAHVDSATSLETFVPRPDWVFSRQQRPGREDPSSAYRRSPILEAILDILAYPCHYNIPFHNFFGWFVTAVVMYTCIFLCRPSLNHIYLSVSSVSKGKDKKPAMAVVGVTGHSMHLWSPVVAGLLCTQCFYLLHPCHPLLVRCCSFVYLLVLSAVTRACLSNQHLSQ